MAIKLKDSADIFDIWKMAQKYSCDDFHNMLKHKLINTKTKPVILKLNTIKNIKKYLEVILK